MKFLLVISAILFCLFVSSIANAQCAWVLWQQRVYYRIEYDNPIERKYWEVMAAFPSYEQCLERKRVLFTKIKESIRKSNPKVDAVPFELVIEHFTEISSLHHIFMCLPDTIDPRK
jgi:hypothetical protein